MPTEQYANVDTTNGLAVTTLNGGINNSTTSITVHSASGFPSSVQYRIVIDQELMIVTAGAGTTSWTVTRGAEGTTAASHSDSAPVTHVLTRDGLKGISGSIILDGVDSGRPAAGTDGRLFLPSDNFVLYRDNSSAWKSFGPVFPFTAPVDGDYAWVNQGGASVTASNGAIYLLAPATAGDQNRIRKKSSPGGSYSVTAALIPNNTGDPATFFSLGVCFRQSSTGKLVLFTYTKGVGTPNFPSIQVQKWTNETTFSATYSTNWNDLRHYKVGGLLFLKIADNTTNLIFSISQDGVNFQQIHSVSRTDFLLTTGPDEIGFFANANSATYDVGLNLLSWTQA